MKILKKLSLRKILNFSFNFLGILYTIILHQIFLLKSKKIHITSKLKIRMYIILFCIIFILSISTYLMIPLLPRFILLLTPIRDPSEFRPVSYSIVKDTLTENSFYSNDGTDNFVSIPKVNIKANLIEGEDI